ncbi:histidine phosphatase family protein [Thioclava sp. A2]|uniref:histidine phosphatase family protein n=1 Tax=Thioclava sp. FCG-A2 TaxID=3080562 RepID=UPI002955C4E6|nr:histidine phosphatase family protein [Thioclava sp. A2]MDV7269725.1 histidine phosphatase family protein [Thioclava sp. A2]
MPVFEGPELVLIRHAPADHGGRLCGRTDVGALLDGCGISAAQEWLTVVSSITTSPALRCRQTAAAIWPARGEMPHDARLWEQDFGAQEGMFFRDLPDLGLLTNAELASVRPPEGESFADLCARTHPALADYAARSLAENSPVCLVVHAGVIRAALALALGDVAAGLAFEVAPFSMTRLRVLPTGGFSIICTNRGFA